MTLKLSYDFLEDESEKSLFLLCCLFPEDYNIKIEDLSLLSFGLRLFKGINNIEHGRIMTRHLLENLRNRFLLMTGKNEDEVKMHDVVRDVAIFIGSKEKQGFLKSLEVCSTDSSRNCTWMSADTSIANANLPIGLDFPNLRLLMILNSSGYVNDPKTKFNVSDICFKGMEELTVLYFSYQNFQSLPSSLRFLRTLRKLHLDSCQVKDISVVGKLASLEILRIWNCYYIEELPADLRELKFLRLLKLEGCMQLKRIVPGVISSLVTLEELEIFACFSLNLSELEMIAGSIPEGSYSFQNLQSLVVDSLPKLGYLWKRPNQNVSPVNLKSITISSCPNLRYLFSTGTARSLVQLQSLEISFCDTMEQVLWNEMESNTEASMIEFLKLEKLKLGRLRNLLAFTQGVEIVKFPQLIEANIRGCPKLEELTIGNLPIDSEHTHERHPIHFFCHQKVEIIGLKKLVL